MSLTVKTFSATVGCEVSCRLLRRLIWVGRLLATNERAASRRSSTNSSVRSQWMRSLGQDWPLWQHVGLSIFFRPCA